MSLRRPGPPGHTRSGEAPHSSSQAPPTTNIYELWNAALAEYRRSINVDLCDHTNPFVQQLERCPVTEADILDILQGASSRVTDKRQGVEASRAIRKVLKPIVGGLCVILDASAETASSVGVPGGKGIFAAIAILLKAADRVTASYDNFEKLFGRLHMYVERMKVRLQVPVGQETAKIAVKALVEVLKAFELATKMVQRGRIRHYLHALLSKTDNIQVALTELEDITTEEERMSITQLIVDVHGMSSNVQLLNQSISTQTKSVDESRPASDHISVVMQAMLLETRTSNAKLDSILAFLPTSQLDHPGPGNSMLPPLGTTEICPPLYDAEVPLPAVPSQASDTIPNSTPYENPQGPHENPQNPPLPSLDDQPVHDAPPHEPRLFQDFIWEQYKAGNPEGIPLLRHLIWNSMNTRAKHSSEPSDPKHLFDLAIRLCDRVELLGNRKDLDDAIIAFEQAHELTGGTRPGNLQHFLDYAVHASRRHMHRYRPKPVSSDEVPQSTPDGRRPKQSDNIGDLGQAGSRPVSPADFTPDEHPVKPRRPDSQCGCSPAPFKGSGKCPELELAISALRRALELASDDHPLRPTLLDHLDAVLRERSTFGD